VPVCSTDVSLTETSLHVNWNGSYLGQYIYNWASYFCDYLYILFWYVWVEFYVFWSPKNFGIPMGLKSPLDPILSAFSWKKKLFLYKSQKLRLLNTRFSQFTNFMSSYRGISSFTCFLYLNLLSVFKYLNMQSRLIFQRPSQKI
jgi:hypothetical protein